MTYRYSLPVSSRQGGMDALKPKLTVRQVLIAAAIVTVEIPGVNHCVGLDMAGQTVVAE